MVGGDKKKGKKGQSPEFTNPVDFYKSYVNSPIFAQRSANNQTIKQQALQGLQNGNYFLLPDHYVKPGEEYIGSRVTNPSLTESFNDLWKDKKVKIPKNTGVILDPVQGRKLMPYDSKNFPESYLFNDIYAHEAAHLMRRDLGGMDSFYFMLDNKDQRGLKLIKSPEYAKWKDSSDRSKQIREFDKREPGISDYMDDLQLTKNANYHDVNPRENYADLNGLRWLMYKKGIYDTRSGEMTQEHLNKAKADPYIQKAFNFGRIRKHFSDKDIISLNNRVASNEPGESDQAKNGKFMKAKPKYFTYENLPMAAFGMYQDPGPRYPQMGQAAQGLYNDYYGGYSESDPKPFTRMQSLQPIGDINTNRIKPGKSLGKKDLQPPKQDSDFLYNPGTAALLGMAAFDAGIPDPYKKHYVNQPQLGYNPYPQGTGSQALMQDGGEVPMPMPRTKLTPKQEKQYNEWRGKLPKNLQYDGNYNLKQLWLENPNQKPSANMHFPDRYKLPNHPTFSNESMYFNPTNQYRAGHWQETDSTWNYAPYNEAYKEPIIERKGDSGYVLGEDEGNTPSAKSGGWIGKATASIKKRGTKGVCTGSKFGSSSCPPGSRRYALAKTFKKMAKKRKKEEGGFIQPGWDQYNYGGIIPDNMSVFNPHRYRQGGNVNGGAQIREVGPHYPNSDLLEQWLLYANGGNINGEARLQEVDAHYPNADMMEQWLLYENGGTLSAAKAKEMLKDGTANGKKLTKKQKEYFGMVASGKAAGGMDMSGDPVTPSHSPIRPQPYYKQAGSMAGNNAHGTLNAMDRPEMEMGKGIDLINESIRSGQLPHKMAPDKAKAYRDMLDPKMYNYLYEFNNRSDLKSMNPQQRLDAFYNIQSADPQLQSMKNNMRRFGYGPQEFQRTSPMMPSVPAGNIAGMASGGVMYDDGGEIDTMWGGNAELESYNPYDGGTVAFNGASHDDGGIGMHYNGNPIEVEGGEYASKDDTGNLHIYGNMRVPGSKTKFKSVAKAMAEKENRYNYLKSRGSELVNNANPADKYEQLTFNSGKAMMNGGNLGQADIAKKKEKLSGLQKAMLDMAAEYGLEPQAMSQGKMKKARGGASIPFYQDGGDPSDPTRADRNMNPGNIKYGDFAKKYGAKKDKDGFAIFPDRKAGEKAMRDLLTSKGYKDMSAKDAISKWTDGHPYRYDLGPLTDKKIGEMDPDELSIVMGTMTKGEGTRYGVRPSAPKPTPTNPTPKVPEPGPFKPYTLPDVPLTQESTPSRRTSVVNPPPLDKINVAPDPKRPTNVEPLHANQLMGEIYAAATNHVEPVPAQRFEPQLYSPYQVSFQDRLNENERTFNAQMRSVGSTNPSAMGALAAQKYAADSQVKAEEFRTNQSIANDIVNKNISLTNDAQMKNLGIADQQMVRQSEARSKTRQLNQMTVNSLSSKYAQNEFENKRLAAYENLYDYRFVPTDGGGLKATYYGPNAAFNFDPKAASQRNDMRTVSRYDQSGNLKGYTQYDDYDIMEQSKLLDLEKKRRNLPLMTTPKLD